ncbi:MAG: transcriptional regulator, partial [Bradyrhizobium sp.]|nr:transcriptional regulator [Bradyrhizobium sp.]
GLAPLVDWMALYGAFWRDRFDRLEDLLKRMDQ